MTSTSVISTSGSTRIILRKRLDRYERLLAACSLPVGEQLVVVELSPLSYQRKRAVRQRAGDELTVECDRGGSAGVPGVEVRAGMGTLVPVHPDRDPVE